MDSQLKNSALQYHRMKPAGKMAVVPTKPLSTQRDLSLAYSPGVSAACEAIVADSAQAAELTGRANLVAVISNGTAVLGLGAIGPLAGKPVMEGKAALFRKFAGINVFDLEIDETDPERFVEIVASLEPTFGGINLEDIRAPECFIIEERLRERMKIPVFHDDQHGTAIVVAAAVLNALTLVDKKLEEIQVAVSGAGAAAIACLNLLVELGLPKAHIRVADLKGVLHTGRQDLSCEQARYNTSGPCRSIAEILHGADLFLGLSGPKAINPEMVASMAANPIIMALANPTPEIYPAEIRQVRSDAIIATGRSDYPNQVNNVLCFPFLFRGALDVGATCINTPIKVACVRAIANLAREAVPEAVAIAYSGENLHFGPDYLLPKPFDPRLIVEVALATAQAAMASQVATRPIVDLESYRQQLSEFVFRSGQVMRPIFERAKRHPQKRVALAHGEEERVLHAANEMIEEGICRPILVGQRAVIMERIQQLGLNMACDRDFEVMDIADDPRIKQLCDEYHQIMERKGVTPGLARRALQRSTSLTAALLTRRGDADAMLCGAVGQIRSHLRTIRDIIGRAEGVRFFSALSGVILDSGTFFISDTNVIADPTVEQLAEMTIRAARQLRRFGLTPQAALLSSSSFGSYRADHTTKMRDALALIHKMAPELEAEGEMRADAALSEEIRHAMFPRSRLKGRANLLIMPNLDAANISCDMLLTLGNGERIGPILLGPALPAHVMIPTVSVRGLVNMAAFAVVQAQELQEESMKQANRLNTIKI
ncbi:MAG: NADP-dependent malic enzyme [Magnetococcales bacterium]|nr:NADP-dependent malic enzyme [Magnetococcales bacterium]MBF0113570.1 NADP-dependent malic enzyme [Magnetococcales bacterium]